MLCQPSSALGPVFLVLSSFSSAGAVGTHVPGPGLLRDGSNTQPAGVSSPRRPTAELYHPLSEVCLTDLRKNSYLEKSGRRRRGGFVMPGFLIVCLGQ